MRYALIPSLIVLILGWSGAAKPLDDDTRENVIAQTRSVFGYWDHDHDGRLNQAEVEAMAAAGFPLFDTGPPPNVKSEELERIRQELFGYWRSQDTNRDGYLTLGEMLKVPLATFKCMDVNHDGKRSQEEIVGGMQRCAGPDLETFDPMNVR